MKYKKLREISLALAPSHPSDQRCRHFSFIMNKKKILSIGTNNMKTHPKNLKFNFVNKYNDPINDLVGTHSELNALIKLGLEDCTGLVLVNTRVNRNGTIDFSKPCRGCLDMLQRLNFKKVFFTNKKGEFEQLV